MTSVVTREIDGHQVSARCAAGQERAAADVLESLRHERAKPLDAGYRFRFGWSVFTLVQEGGVLWLCEPDFDRDPLRDVRPRIDVSLQVIVRQLAVVRMAGGVPADVHFDDLITVAPGALEQPELHMIRERPSQPGDSGWRAWPGEGGARDGQDVEAIHVFELLTRRPAALSALALSEGTAVIIDGERIVPVAR